MMHALMLAGLLAGPAAEPPARGAGLDTVLRELWLDGLDATVQKVHFGRGPEQKPGSVAFTLHVELVPGKGLAAIDQAAIRKFLDHWSAAVRARGVTMEVAQIDMKADRAGKGVGLLIAGVLP